MGSYSAEATLLLKGNKW